MNKDNGKIIAIILIVMIATGITTSTIQYMYPNVEYVQVSSWPTVEEMQEFAGATVDGIWGPETDRLYRQAQERWYLDQGALTELRAQNSD